MRLRHLLLASALLALYMVLPVSAQREGNKKPSLTSRTTSSVSGRIFGINGNGDIKPARFAHVYLLYEWSGKPKGPGAKDDDSDHAYLAFLKKQNAEMDKKLTEHDVSCRRGLLVFLEAVSYALKWSQENGRPKEVMGVDTE